MNTLLFADGTILEIDATFDLNYHLENEITDNEVEDGLDINDTIIKRPKTLSLNGFFTNVPLSMQEVYKFDMQGPHQLALDKIEKARDNGEAVTLDATHRGYWDNLAIQSFDANWSYDFGSGLPFSMSLKQINLVSPQIKFNSLAASGGNGFSIGGQEGLKPIDKQVGRMYTEPSKARTDTVATTTKQDEKLTDLTSYPGVDEGIDFFR